MSAKQADPYFVDINIEPTGLSRYADYSLYGKAGEVLPKILEEVKQPLIL